MVKKNKITFFDKIMFLVTFVLAVGLVFGIHAGDSDPRSNMIVAFFGLAFPFFLGANIIILIYWFIRRMWLMVLLLIVLLAYGHKTIRATFGFFGTEGKETKAEASLLRVLTYNVHYFKPFGEDLTEDVKNEMFDVVSNQHPDVVCFQEFYSRNRGNYNTIESLNNLLGTKYHYFVPSQRSSKESIGMAIFSKYPMVTMGRIPFEDSSGNEAIYVDLKINEKIVRIYNVHLQSISFGKEDYQYLEKATKDMEPKLTPSKRIVKMLRTAFRKRSDQVDIMKEHISTCTTPYIIAGDFNDTPASYSVTQLTGALNNAFVEKGNGFGKTYNGKFPNFQIDYIASSKEIDVVNYHIIKAQLSDHYPVRSDLRLNN